MRAFQHLNKNPTLVIHVIREREPMSRHFESDAA